MKSRRIRWTGHGEIKNEYKLLVLELEVKKCLGDLDIDGSK
jgi:hypothetical protein